MEEVKILPGIMKNTKDIIFHQTAHYIGHNNQINIK